MVDIVLDVELVVDMVELVVEIVELVVDIVELVVLIVELVELVVDMVELVVEIVDEVELVVLIVELVELVVDIVDEVELVVEDNGKGLSPKFDIYHSPSLGLQLTVATVMRELGGSIDVVLNKGTQFIIRFKYKSQ